MSQSEVALAVDIGGTKLAAGRVGGDGSVSERLAALTGLPVHVDNDAKALALGEGWTGAAWGAGNYIAMVVSTGVGGGIVLDGRLLDGATGNAGHIGHVIVDPGGRVCGCGAQGCLEAEASGPSIRAATGLDPQDVGEDVRRRVGTLVGRAVATVANLLDLRPPPLPVGYRAAPGAAAGGARLVAPPPVPAAADARVPPLQAPDRLRRR